MLSKKKKKSSLSPYANVESDQVFLSWALNFANHLDLRKERFLLKNIFSSFSLKFLSEILGTWDLIRMRGNKVLSQVQQKLCSFKLVSKLCPLKVWWCLHFFPVKIHISVKKIFFQFLKIKYNSIWNMYYEVSDQNFMAILWKHYKCFLTDLLVRFPICWDSYY